MKKLLIKIIPFVCIISLTGCTAALINSMDERYVSYPITDNYSLKVIDACLDDSRKRPMIIIVIARHDKEYDITDDFIVEYYDPHYSTYEMRFNLPSYHDPNMINVDGAIVVGAGFTGMGSKRNSERDICDDFASIPILELKGKEVVSLTKGSDDSIYVQYQNNNLISLGYVSNTTFLDNHYSFSVDITKLPAYYLRRKESGNNPLVLIFTPVTVVLDTAGILLVAPGLVLNCIDEPDCLK